MKPTQSCLVAAVLAAAACSDSSFKPTVDTVSGIYHFQSFTTDSAGHTTDWIAAGASIDLLVVPGGSLGGEFVIPPIPPDSLVRLALMRGTWTLTADTVRFSQTVDTFIRDMPWIAGEGRLTGDDTFGGVRVRIVLTK
jgi:hypothetical protein